MRHDFMQKIMIVIDRIAPIKERRVKRNSQEWFVGETVYETKYRNKLFKKFVKPKFQIDTDIYNMAKYIVRKIIFDKKRLFSLKKN